VAEEKQKISCCLLRLRALYLRDLILSSLFGRKKKTAVSFATRTLSVAAVEEGQQICCCCFIYLSRFDSPHALLVGFFLTFSLSFFLSLFQTFSPIFCFCRQGD
jgi:hypothetical protein